jgi:hypothetical protein
MSAALNDVSRRTLTAGDRYLALLAIVLLGYALMGKGFAYIGFRPLYVGEIAFFTGIAVFVRLGVLVASLATLPSLVLAATMMWVLARTVPFVSVYGFDALRDSVIICMAGLRFRHWAVGGRAQDRYRASLLQRVSGEFSRNGRGVLAHQILGRLYPEIVRSERADHRDHTRRPRTQSSFRSARTRSSRTSRVSLGSPGSRRREPSSGVSTGGT